MKQIWNRYRSTVFQNCTDASQSSEELSYWRNYLFALTILYIAPLSFIAIIPGIYMAFITGLQFLFIANILTLLILPIIAFYPGLSLGVRKFIFFFGLYLASTALLYELGSFGPGLIFLLATTFFITLIYDEKKAIWSVYIITVICITFGVLIYFEATESIMLQEYRIDSWFALSANLIFLCLVAVLIVPGLFRGLQSSLQKRNQLQAEVLKNKEELEQSMIQLKEKALELQESNRELEQFAYTASHDLKEPLRMIRNFMDLLEKNYAPQLDDKAKKYIHFAADGAKRMNELIDDLLEYSRISRLYSEFETVDMNKLVDSVIGMFEAQIEEQNAVVGREQLPQVIGVPVSLKLVFQNLIGNALKYHDKNTAPRVEIKGEETETHWAFSVSDNGIGIDEKYFDEIFLLFKRLHSNSEYSGTGMGLAMCKKVVEQHGGEIWVTSEKGKGSTFYFTIKKDRQA